MCRTAEDLGYDVLSMADHFGNALSPIPALAVAAEATTTLRLATMVFGNDFRHPTVVARDAATLDALSGGRFELGIGAGWMIEDYEQSGMELERAGVRIERLRESVELLKQAFTGEETTVAGEHYDVRGFRCNPPPVQPGGPPIFMGGGGPRMLGVAGQLADIVGINPNLAAGVFDEGAGADATLERTMEKISWIRDAAGARFGSIELQSRIHLAMISDDGTGLAEQLAPAFGLTADQAMASPHALIGSPGEIAEKLQRLRETVGVSYFTWSADSMHDLAPVIAMLR